MASLLLPEVEVPDWRGWSLAEKQAFLLRLREDATPWREQARPDQLPPDDDDWATLLLTGGRGSGKTWTGSHLLGDEIEQDPLLESEGPGEWAIVAPTFGDARDKCVEGESGFLAALHTTKNEVEAGISPTVEKWNRSNGEMWLRDGSKIIIAGADDGAPKIQGTNLRGIWCDEIGLWKKWKEAWDEAIGYAVRKGRARRIATGTPKRDKPARALVKRLLNDPRVISRRLLTADNWHNLSAVFKETALLTKDTELGKQELEGLLLDEAEGALWKRDWLKHGRLDPRQAPGSCGRRVLALDTADGSYEGDEQAWCLAAEGAPGKYYVLGSEGMRTTPTKWLTAAVVLADQAGAAIVYEKNHGGEFVADLLEQVMNEVGIRVPVFDVTATDGKRTRAEPVSMLYEQGFNRQDPVVYHVGEFPDLEDQMCNWTGEPGVPSPDRMDALVWAITALMKGVGVRKRRKVVARA